MCFSSMASFGYSKAFSFSNEGAVQPHQPGAPDVEMSVAGPAAYMFQVSADVQH